MAKILFSIEHREKIESGEYKVIYLSYGMEEEFPARIICWDRHNKHPIVALISNSGGYERVAVFQEEGIDNSNPHQGTLLIVTPEPELTPFEAKLIQFSDERNSMECDNLPEDREEETLADHLHRKAAELLSIARKQLQPEIDAEIEKAYKTADEVQYRKGREEALKDLPRWKPSNCPRSNLPSLYLTGDGTALYKDGYEISISGLEKLPKEETNL